MHRHAEKLWTHDAGLSALLGLLFLQIFVVFPFVDSTAGKMLVPIVFTLIVVSGVMTVIGTPHWGRMVIVLGILSLMSRLVTYERYSAALESLNTVLSIFFIGLLMFVILIQVFREGPVNAHRIAGSVAVYLLLGTLWGSIYFLIALHAPWSFQFTAGSVPAQPHALAAKFVYFSFITLTSVGYGDIVPVHPLAQTTATLEAIIGQLFPAILLARLVSLEIADRSSARPCGQDDPDSTGRSTE